MRYQVIIKQNLIFRMLDISRAGVDRSNAVVCLENGTTTTGTNTPHSNASNNSSSRKYCTNRPTNGEDLREYAHRLCRDYLRGAWLSVHSHELIIKKVRLVSDLQIYLVRCYVGSVGAFVSLLFTGL